MAFHYIAVEYLMHTLTYFECSWSATLIPAKEGKPNRMQELSQLVGFVVRYLTQQKSIRFSHCQYSSQTLSNWMCFHQFYFLIASVRVYVFLFWEGMWMWSGVFWLCHTLTYFICVLPNDWVIQCVLRDNLSSYKDTLHFTAAAGRCVLLPSCNLL